MNEWYPLLVALLFCVQCLSVSGTPWSTNQLPEHEEFAKNQESSNSFSILTEQSSSSRLNANSPTLPAVPLSPHTVQLGGDLRSMSSLTMEQDINIHHRTPHSEKRVREQLYRHVLQNVRNFDSTPHQCHTKSDCSNNGDCEKGKCNCYVGWNYNKNCSVQWKDVIDDWKPVFMSYRILTVLVDFALTAWSAWQLYVRMVLIPQRKNEMRFGVVTQVLSLVLLGLLIRVIYFCIDPHRITALWPTYVDVLLFNLPYIFWLEAFCLLLVLWNDMSISSGVYKTQPPHPLIKPLLYILFLLLTLTLMPLAFYRIFFPSHLSIAAYLLGFVLWLAGLTVAGVFLGWRLLRTLRLVFGSNQPSHPYRLYVIKLVRTLIVYVVLVVLFVSTAILYATWEAPKDAWKWMSLTIVFRIVETAYVGCTLFLVHRPREKEEEHASSSDINEAEDPLLFASSHHRKVQYAECDSD